MSTGPALRCLSLSEGPQLAGSFLLMSMWQYSLQGQTALAGVMLGWQQGCFTVGPCKQGLLVGLCKQGLQDEAALNTSQQLNLSLSSCLLCACI